MIRIYEPLARSTMDFVAALTSGRQARDPDARCNCLYVSQRPAYGFTRRQAAWAKRTSAAAIVALLAQAGFRALLTA